MLTGPFSDGESTLGWHVFYTDRAVEHRAYFPFPPRILWEWEWTWCSSIAGIGFAMHGLGVRGESKSLSHRPLSCVAVMWPTSQASAVQ